MNQWKVRSDLAHRMRRAASLCCLFAGTTAGAAAEISVVPAGPEITLVVVSGEFTAGDAQAFRALTSGLRNAAVLLEGPGGILVEGLDIGRAINSRGFATGVGPGAVCSSACALAWAGGSPRYMAPNALIGFHAAYEDPGGEAMTSSVGNALVGAYLSEIGFREEGIIFATSAGPDGMLWLDLLSADALGIPVVALENAEKSEGPQEETTIPLQLPRGYRWIVLASAKDVDSLPRLDEAIFPHFTMTVSTSTGYLAAVVGPFTAESAEQLLANWILDASVPGDAYLSSGNGFVGRLADEN